MRRLLPIALLSAAAILAPSAGAVVVYDPTTPFQNTTTSGLTADEAALEDVQGEFRGFLVTAVSPIHVLAAKHIGGSLSDVVTFASGPNAGTYGVQSFVDDPGSDLRLWELDGPLMAWAELYDGTGELNQTLTVFGRGGPPGAAVFVNSQLRGWEWGSGPGAWSWGRNRVDRFMTDASDGPLVVLDFESNGLPNECHLSSGDSSGPWFIEDTDGAWKLAAVASSVSGPFQQDAGGSPAGNAFDAMLFDMEGLWVGEPGEEVFLPDRILRVTPSSAFGVRVSDRLCWLAPLLAFPDGDGDGVPDACDNCIEVGNASQLDTDDDGFGNACDCDFNQTGFCNIGDFNVFLPDFISRVDSGVGTDMNGSGVVNIGDFNLFLIGFAAREPGPSAFAP